MHPNNSRDAYPAPRLGGTIENEKKDTKEIAHDEWKLGQRIEALTKYCKTLAMDRRDYRKREQERTEELAKLKQEMKEKRQLFKMLYHYAADRLSEVDQLERDVATLQVEKSDSSPTCASVSGFYRPQRPPNFPVKNALGKRKADEAHSITSSVETSSDVASPQPNPSAPPCAVKDATESIAEIATIEASNTPPKRIKLSDSSTKLPRNVVSCTQCYAHGRQCDHGAPCKSCIDNKKCKRMRCGTYGKGEKQCFDRHGFLAHPEDGYANMIQCSGARREKGLPPVNIISDRVSHAKSKTATEPHKATNEAAILSKNKDSNQPDYIAHRMEAPVASLPQPKLPGTFVQSKTGSISRRHSKQSPRPSRHPTTAPTSDIYSADTNPPSSTYTLHPYESTIVPYTATFVANRILLLTHTASALLSRYSLRAMGLTSGLPCVFVLGIIEWRWVFNTPSTISLSSVCSGLVAVHRDPTRTLPLRARMTARQGPIDG